MFFLFIQMGVAQTASVPRSFVMKYMKRGARNFFLEHPERSKRNVVDSKAVFIANFFIATCHGKTSFASNLHPFCLQAGIFLDLLGGLGAQVGPSNDFRTFLGCFWDGLGRPWGPFGFLGGSYAGYK